MAAPKEQIKSLQYALETCDIRKLKAIIATRQDLAGNASMDVFNWMKCSKTIYREKFSALQGAVTVGNFSICKRLIDEGAPLESEPKTLPPLSTALQHGHSKIARLLLESGAQVNVPSADLMPMFFVFIHKESSTVEMVQAIIEAGFPKDGIIDLLSKTRTIHLAASMNNVDIMKYLLSLQVNPNFKDIYGRTALHYAAQSGLTGMVIILVENGANLNSECVLHFTPIFYAITAGNCEMVKLLLSLGVDIHYVNGDKKSPMMPLHYAVKMFQFQITKLLIESGADVNKVVPFTGEIALHSAARATPQNSKQNKIALDCIVHLLVNSGSDVNLRHKYGLTSVQVALQYNNLRVAKILIEHGSAINNEVPGTSMTTFHMVAQSLKKDLISLCLEFGGDFKAKDGDGMYPCHQALLATMKRITLSSEDTQALRCQDEDEQMAIFSMFWKAGFPFDLTLEVKWLNANPPYPSQLLANIKKQKMLFTAVQKQQPKVVEKAINQGAVVKCCSTDIPYPLHFIASKGNDVILKLFLNKGALVHCVDKRGETPLHVAAKAGHFKCCKLLLEYGASYNYYSEECLKNPLKMAQDNGHSEVVTLLKTVDKFFKAIKKGNFKKLKPDMNIFTSVMNCCSRHGLTLMATAIKCNRNESARLLMKLRLQMESIN